MLVVSSVSRAYYGIQRQESMRKADDPSVYLAAAKESGDVDYAAAVVVHLDVLPVEPGVDHRVARLAVAKSRHGRTGFVGARFYGASGRWAAGPDDVLARGDVRQSRQDEDDDAAVLGAIRAAATRDEYRTARGWRDLVPGVPEKRVRAAVSRLHANGKITLDTYHPKTTIQARGGGEYVVPVAPPQPTPAPLLHREGES
jgi:hypothetical protein